jgi:hypothetical protein
MCTGEKRRLLNVSVPFRSIARLLMDEPILPEDFKEFLRLLNENAVEYLLIGGYAVGYHGYPRTTADMDIWVALNPGNATKLVAVFHAFGMQDSNVTEPSTAFGGAHDD